MWGTVNMDWVLDALKCIIVTIKCDKNTIVLWGKKILGEKRFRLKCLG